MATTLSATLKANVTASLSETLDLGSAAVNELLNFSQAITDGAVANKATQVWGDTRSLALSTSEDLDLSGVLVNGLGDTVTLTRVVALMISCPSTNGSTVTVGNAAANAWEGWISAAGTISIRPGGCLFLVAPDVTGYAVTAGTGDLLMIENDDGAAAASYSIIVIGSEA